MTHSFLQKLKTSSDFPKGIYPNQWKAINDFLTIFLSKKQNNAVCKAECMSGKTGVACGLAWVFKKYYSKQNVGVIFILNQSSVSNRDQTEERFLADAKLNPIPISHFNQYPQDLLKKNHCLILHSDDITRLDLSVFSKFIRENNTLILNDEVHHGAGAKGRIFNFFKTLVGESNVTRHPKNSKFGYEILSVASLPKLKIAQFSATPFSQYTRDHKIPKVHLDNTEQYCSIRFLMENDRLVDHRNITILDAKTNQIAPEFLDILKYEYSQNKNGYYLIRLNNQSDKFPVEVAIRQKLKLGNKIEFKDIHHKSCNISDFLNFTLGCTPKVPTIVFYYKSLVMGSEIACGNINMIWEPKTLCIDTYFQRLGRSAGYKHKNDDKFKKNFTYRIYCDLPFVQENLYNYETGEPPTHARSTNTSPSERNKNPVKMIPLKNRIWDGKNGKAHQEVLGILNKYYPNHSKSINLMPCSTTNVNSVAETVYKCLNRFNNAKEHRVLFLDAPNPSHVADWMMLTPFQRGKLFVSVPDTNYKPKAVIKPKRAVMI